MCAAREKKGATAVERQKEIDRLPPPDTQRWVMRRKAQVVAAVRSGILTFDEACERYRLSQEEFKAWLDLLDHRTIAGLSSALLPCASYCTPRPLK